MEVHDPSLPIAVTHTGADGVHPMWRNVDDDQIRAVAATGGVVGVIYADWFLGGPYWGAPGTERIFAHLAHIVDVGGEDTAALGSDWDGMICPPTDLPTCLEMPRVVQHMLDAGWGEERIRKVLGANALRMMEAIRP